MKSVCRQSFRIIIFTIPQLPSKTIIARSSEFKTTIRPLLSPVHSYLTQKHTRLIRTFLMAQIWIPVSQACESLAQLRVNSPQDKSDVSPWRRLRSAQPPSAPKFALLAGAPRLEPPNLNRVELSRFSPQSKFGPGYGPSCLDLDLLMNLLCMNLICLWLIPVEPHKAGQKWIRPSVNSGFSHRRTPQNRLQTIAYKSRLLRQFIHAWFSGFATTEMV